MASYSPNVGGAGLVSGGRGSQAAAKAAEKAKATLISRRDYASQFTGDKSGSSKKQTPQIVNQGKPWEGTLSTPTELPQKIITLPEGTRLSRLNDRTTILYTNKFGQLTGQARTGGSLTQTKYTEALRGQNLGKIQQMKGGSQYVQGVGKYLRGLNEGAEKSFINATEKAKLREQLLRNPPKAGMENNIVLKQELISKKDGIPTYRYYWKNEATGEISNLTDEEFKEVNRGNVKTIQERREEVNYIKYPAIEYNFKSKKDAWNTSKAIGKLLLKSTKTIPNVTIDYANSLAKGFVKSGLYAIDNKGMINNILYNPKTGKLFIPAGTKALSDNAYGLGKVKRWSGYDYKTNPFKDPDYQNALITTSLIAVGVTSPGTAAKIFGVVKGKAVWDAIKNPTEYNVAVAESLFLPGGVKKLRQTLGRNDILVAKKGSLVPEKERIKQIDYLINNAGKKVEAITSTPKKNVKLRINTNKNSPDYTYGKKVEFATYKVGKAYPTSEYFLKGKATKIQKVLKSGVVKIENAVVSNLNRKYGKFIKNNLLDKGKVSESFIKKYYNEAKIEANKLGKPVVVISPKRLRGFEQPEQEMIKILPDKYKQPSLKFSGFTREGYRVYSDKPYSKSLGQYVKSKFTKGKIERSYFKEMVGEKLEYLKGRRAIKGEYGEHGIGHLKAENVDSSAKQYARKVNIKKYGNVFEKHDLAKVGDEENFAQFEHGKVLKDLWRKGDLPNDMKVALKDIPKKLQRKIFDAYAGHTPVKPRLLDTLKKGWKDNSVVKDFIWYAKNKRNPYLQDVLTLDRLELPRAGRWNFKVKYNLLDKNAVKRIYGSELNAVKNIRFLDWNKVPRRLKRRIGVKNIKQIQTRDRQILTTLKRENVKIPRKNIKYKYERNVGYKNKLSGYKLTKGYKSGTQYKQTTNYRSNAYKTTKGYKGGNGYKPTGYKPTKGYKPSAGYKPTGYTPGKTPRVITPPKPVLFIPKKRKAMLQLKQKEKGYFVYARPLKKYKWQRQPKLVRVNKAPVTKQKARDLRNYIVDTSLSRTAQLKQTNLKPRTLKFNIPAGYSQRTTNKFRTFRIVNKRRVPMMNERVIEKNRNLLDTSQEKRRMDLSRRIAEINRVPLPRKTITFAKREILLERLKKARAVRMRNLRRR